MTEESSRTLKIVLGGLLIILFTAVVFVVLTKKETEKTVSTTVIPVVDQLKIVNPTPKAPTISPQEVSAQAQALQDQVKAGTISPEDAKKARDAMLTKAGLPLTPPIKK